MKKNILFVFFMLLVFSFVGVCYGEEDFSDYIQGYEYKKSIFLPKIWIDMEFYFYNVRNEFICVSKSATNKYVGTIQGLSEYLEANNISNEQLEFGKVYRVYFKKLVVVNIEGIRSLEEIQQEKNSKNTEDDFEFRITEDAEGLAIIGYKNQRKTNIEIPEKIQGLPVLEVAFCLEGYGRNNDDYKDNEYIKCASSFKCAPEYKVSFPDTIRSISIESRLVSCVRIENLPSNLVSLELKWRLEDTPYYSSSQSKKEKLMRDTPCFAIKSDFDMPKLNQCKIEYTRIENKEPIKCKNLTKGLSSSVHDSSRFERCVFDNPEIFYYAGWNREGEKWITSPDVRFIW